MFLSFLKFNIKLTIFISLFMCAGFSLAQTSIDNTHNYPVLPKNVSTISNQDTHNDKEDTFNADGAGGISTMEQNKKITESILHSLNDKEAQKMWQNKYLFLLEQSHLFDVKFPDVKDVGLQFQHARISLQYNKKYVSNMSISNLNPNACIVSFYFGSNNSTIMISNDDENLTFMYLHELAHCLLGKEVLTKGIPWTQEIREQMGDENVIKINQELVYASLGEIQKQHQDTHHIYDSLDEKIDNASKLVPIFVYHETFADTQAMIWIAKMYPRDFESILNQMIVYRKTQFKLFKQKHLSYDHPTFYALETLKQYIDKHPNKIFNLNALEAKNLALTASQIGFLNYLKEEKVSSTAL